MTDVTGSLEPKDDSRQQLRLQNIQLQIQRENKLSNRLKLEQSVLHLPTHLDFSQLQFHIPLGSSEEEGLEAGEAPALAIRGCHQKGPSKGQGAEEDNHPVPAQQLADNQPAQVALAQAEPTQSPIP